MSKITRRALLRLTSTVIVGNVLVGCRNAPENHLIIMNPDKPFITRQGRTLPSDAAPLEKQILYEPAADPRHLDISRDIYGAVVAINWARDPPSRRGPNLEPV